MSSDEAALRALTNGTVGIALGPGPALWALQRSDAGYAKLRLLSPSPLPAASADVGAAVLANDSSCAAMSTRRLPRSPATAPSSPFWTDTVNLLGGPTNFAIKQRVRRVAELGLHRAATFA